MIDTEITLDYIFLQAIQGGHAILLGMSYSTGRATLTRLAAYIAHCKVWHYSSLQKSFITSCRYIGIIALSESNLPQVV